MILVTILLVPHGDLKKSSVIGTIEIANDGTGDARTGNYDGTLHAEYTGADGRKGRVENFDRRGKSVWSLVGAFLKLWGHSKHPAANLVEQNQSILPL